MTAEERNDVVKRFNSNDRIKVAVVSFKAGGVGKLGRLFSDIQGAHRHVGLNLTAANHVFLLDLWWTDAAEQQAIDRVHR